MILSMWLVVVYVDGLFQLHAHWTNQDLNRQTKNTSKQQNCPWKSERPKEASNRATHVRRQHYSLGKPLVCSLPFVWFAVVWTCFLWWVGLHPKDGCNARKTLTFTCSPKHKGTNLSTTTVDKGGLTELLWWDAVNVKNKFLTLNPMQKQFPSFGSYFRIGALPPAVAQIFIRSVSIKMEIRLPLFCPGLEEFGGDSPPSSLLPDNWVFGG